MAENHRAEEVQVTHSGFFVLRTPLLPIEELLAWSSDLTARELWQGGADGSVVEKAWLADVEVLRVRLRAVMNRPEPMHALFIASPSLVEAIDGRKHEPWGKRGLQAERAIVRYVTRMCTRATPFGLFSGCSLGLIDSARNFTALVIEPRERYCPHSRLDAGYVHALITGLQKDPSVKMALQYHPNSSLHRVHEDWHYIESRAKELSITHHLVKLENDETLDAVVRRSEGGAFIKDLVEAVLPFYDTNDINEEVKTNIEAYIDELISSQILVSSLYPPVTGPSAVEDLIDQLKSCGTGPSFVDVLTSLQYQINALDSKGVGCSPADYDLLKSHLAALPAEPVDEDFLQVDLIKPARAAVLGKPVVDEIVNGVEALCRLRQNSEPEELRTFREAFSSRYQSAFVPLLEAVDQECGIGFGPKVQGVEASPLLRGLGLARPPASSGEMISDSQLFLLQKVVDCAREGKQQLQLQVADLPANEERYSSLPDALAVTVAIAAESTSSIEDGNFELHLLNISGPSGARLLGRFCHADPNLEACVRHHLREEELQHPDAIFAEIVYLPEGRHGNLVCRPVLRDYEIPFLGRSGAPRHRQIPITDLLVGIKGNSIVLYSRRLGRQVIPRLSTAHNFYKAPLVSAYRFLCYLQHQHGVSAPAFGFGPLQGLEFLPRLSVGRFVLAPARWLLNQEEIHALAKQQRARRFIAMQEIRVKRGLPRWVIFRQSDQALTVDLDNPLSVDAFVPLLRTASEAMLSELSPSPDRLCVTSMEGRFYHELNIPLVVHRPTTSSESRNGSRKLEREPEPSVNLSPNGGARTLPLGSDWLYVKLYGAGLALDDVISTVLPSLVTSTRESGATFRWFFVRYNDPDEHLRIRFQGPPPRILNELLPVVCELSKSLLASGKVWRVQFDTYDREVERYGGPEGLEVAEEIFFRDSEAVVEIFRKSSGDRGPEARWRMALLGADRLLSDCGLNLEARRSITKFLRDSLQREFQASPYIGRELGQKFRAEKPHLEALLGYVPGPSAELALAGPLFEARSETLAPAIAKLRHLTNAGTLHGTISDLACSYVHMHINRLAAPPARTQEFVLYDFLNKLYEGRIARMKQAPVPSLEVMA